MVKMRVTEFLQLLFCRRSVRAVIFAAFCLFSSSEVLAQADMAVTKNAPEFIQAGSNLSYTITVNNVGAVSALQAMLTDTLPDGLTFVSLTQNSGPAFICTTPAAGAGGTVSCTAANFASQAEAQFTLIVNVSSGAAVGTTYTNIATVSSTLDANEENNSSAAATTVIAPSAASVTVSGRVLTQRGRGIRNVLVRLVDESGQHRTVLTSTFGYYRFADIPAGQTYTISVSGKKYSFAQPTQVLNLTGDKDDINFVADN
jgi:uncharacterized repeat protein (TIGR01451 family)